MPDEIERDGRITDALCVKMHTHVAPVEDISSPLVLLPVEVLWEGFDGNHVALFEDASDDGKVWPVLDEVENVDVPMVGPSPMPISAPVVTTQVNSVSVAASAVASAS